MTDQGKDGNTPDHTPRGAPEDAAHQDAGDGTSTGATQAGLTTEELGREARERKTDDGGTG